MVNNEILRQKIQFIEDNLSKLGYLKNLSYEEFAGDFRNFVTAKHLLQVSVEAMIDIANHIVSRRRWGIPEKSADSFRILREHGYFTKHEEDLFVTMIKFRNRVVHLYHKVNEEEVYRILQENLSDFKLFIKAVAKNNF